MAADVINISKRIKGKKSKAADAGFPAQAPYSKPFFVRKTHALSGEELAESISSAIARLENELAEGAKNLRDHVGGYVRNIASGKKDELTGMGLAFEIPERKIRIELADGEAKLPGSEAKVESIVSECIRAAESDLKDLREAQSALQKDGSLSEAGLDKVAVILDGHTYWRYLQTT